MTLDMLLSLTGMALAASWTPGPNNSMLASSGATYGLRATIPHVAGIVIGFPVMIFLVGIGLGEVFRQSPVLLQVLRWVGALMLLWMAWRTATAAPAGQSGRTTRPLTFTEAAAFQWVNPKSWLAAIAITSQFVTPAAPLATALAVAVVFVGAGISATLAWAAFGQAIGKRLNTPLRLRMFNLAMASMLVAFLLALMLGR